MGKPALPTALFLSAFLAAPAARAQHTNHTASSAQNALQQQMRAQQQAFQQQQKLMQQEAQRQQKLMEQQQKLMQQQHQQQLKAQSAASQAHHAATTTGKTHTAASARVVRPSHWLLAWPRGTSSASYRNLAALKRSLDSVASSPTVTPAHTTSLRNALSRVVENSPRPPASHVAKLASDLSTALTSRSGSTNVDTQDLALHLRAMMNVVHMTPVEAEQTLASSQSLLRAAAVPAAHVETVAGDLRYIGTEVSNAVR
jgi:hypothetical protein